MTIWNYPNNDCYPMKDHVFNYYGQNISLCHPETDRINLAHEGSLLN